MALIIRTLGVPSLFISSNRSAPLSLRYRKGYVLIAYLLAERNKWHSREYLSSLLWPDLSLDSAKTNLRQILKSIIDVIKSSCDKSNLRVERDRVGLFPDESIISDLLFFDDTTYRQLSEIKKTSNFNSFLFKAEFFFETIDGDFLSGIDSDDELGDWLQQQRAFVFKARNIFLEELTETAKHCNNIELAIRIARLWVSASPALDQPVQSLMTLLSIQGNKRLIDTTYEEFAHRVARLAGANPLTETKILHDDLMNSEVCVPSTMVNDKHEVRWVVLLHAEMSDEVKNAAVEEEILLRRRAFQDVAHKVDAIPLPGYGNTFCAVLGLPGKYDRPAQRCLEMAAKLQQHHLFSTSRIGICAGKASIIYTEGNIEVLGGLPGQAQRFALLALPTEILVDSFVAEAVRDVCTKLRLHPLIPRLNSKDEKTCRAWKINFLSHSPEKRETQHRLVGRDKEISTLLAIMEDIIHAKQSRGIVMVGEAGIGKTHLANEFARIVESQFGAAALRIFHSPEQRHQPLSGLRILLKNIIGVAATAPEEAIIEAASSWIENQPVPFPASAKEAMLRFLIPEKISTFREEKKELFDGLRLIIDGFAVTRPLLIIVDDAQWADSIFQEWLHHWFSTERPKAIMFIMVSRKTETMLLTGHIFTSMQVNVLSQQKIVELINNLDCSIRLNQQECNSLAVKSGGIPLCAEYLARGQLGLTSDIVSVSATLNLLLDQLGYGKEVIQAGAVLGDTFFLEDLQTLLPGRPLGEALEHACTLGIINRPRVAEYVFRHALLRQCARESTLKKQHREWCLKAASIFMKRSRPNAAVLAEYFEEAGNESEAIRWWLKAATTAHINDFATEAKNIAMRALSLVYAKVGNATRQEILKLELIVAFSRLQLIGYGDQEAHQRFVEVHVQANLGKEQRLRFRALVGGYQGCGSQGTPQGLVFAQLLQEEASFPSQQLVACYAFGNSLFWRGELKLSCQYLEEAIEIGNYLAAKQRTDYMQDDPILMSLAFLAWVKWFLGDLSATAYLIELEEKIGSRAKPHVACVAQTLLAVNWLSRGNASQVKRYAGLALARANRYGYQLWQAFNQLFLLWAEAKETHTVCHSALAKQVAIISTHFKSGEATARWVSVSALAATGELDALESQLDLAIKTAETNAESYCLPDLFGYKSKLLHTRKNYRAAEKWLNKGIDLARTQGNLAWLCKLQGLQTEW